MHRLEHRGIVADIGGGGDAQAAHQAGGEVADDVAVHVGGHDHVELLGRDDKLVGAVVDDDVGGGDIGIFGRHALEDPLHHALGHLHDIGLGRAGELLAPLGLGQREGEADDALAARLGDELEALGGAGALHMLDAGIEVLDVLPHDHEVDATAREGGADAGQFPHRADIAVELKKLAEGDVGDFSPKPTGVSSGPFRARPVRAMESKVSCGQPEAMPRRKTAAPASASSQAILALAAARMRWTACITSGPIPSPAMAVTVVVREPESAVGRLVGVTSHRK